MRSAVAQAAHGSNTSTHFNSSDCTLKMALTSQRHAGSVASRLSPVKPREFVDTEHEVYASVQDMIHASIVYYGNRASLRQVYAACQSMGRIVCRKTGGWRWITDNAHWKSQVRHTLYTSGRFTRTDDHPDFWEVTLQYASCIPQTTSPALLNFTGAGQVDTTHHVLEPNSPSSPRPVILLTRDGSAQPCNWWQGPNRAGQQLRSGSKLESPTDSADELDPPRRSSESGSDLSFEVVDGDNMQQYWLQRSRAVARPAVALGQKRRSWESTSAECHLNLDRQHTRSAMAPDLLDLLAHAAASVTEAPVPRPQVVQPTLDNLTRLLSNPAFAAGFLECRKLLSKGVLPCQESPPTSDLSEGDRAASPYSGGASPSAADVGILSGMEGPLKKRLKVAAKSWTGTTA